MTLGHLHQPEPPDRRRRWPAAAAAVLLAAAAGWFRRRPNFARNLPETPETEPASRAALHSVQDGLAVYAAGQGPPLLLMPYPHGHNDAPIIAGPLAGLLIGLGFRVISFDPPGAYRSTRMPELTMDEMIGCAFESLERLNLRQPLPLVGHSMGGLAALAFTLAYPERVSRLLLVASFSGVPAVIRWGMPGSAFSRFSPDYWRLVVWGLRITAGRADLRLHKRMRSLMGAASRHDPASFQPLPILPEDRGKPLPIRMAWNQQLGWRYTLQPRLGQIEDPTLILAGRQDQEAPPACAQELLDGLPNARLQFFDRSGHAPFIEEPDAFRQAAAAFLAADLGPANRLPQAG